MSNNCLKHVVYDGTYMSILKENNNTKVRNMIKYYGSINKRES